MKPTGIYAERPTPQSIIRYFQKSRKRHLFLTGSRHSGKTTFFRALLPLLPGQSGALDPIPGLTSRAEPKTCVYLRDNVTGRTAVIGRRREEPDGRDVHEGKYTHSSACGQVPGVCPEPGLQMLPVPEGFLQVGIPAVERMLSSGHPWAAIDEIGYLESSCAAYCGMLERLLDCKSVLAVLRRQDTPFLERLSARGDVFLYDLDLPLPTLGCVLMASGEGRRFGGNKLLASFQGRSLMEWSLDATDTDLFTDRLVVTRYPEIAEICQQRGVPFVLHDLPQRSDTIRLGLEALPRDRDGCMFCPCDQPLLTRETIEYMAASFLGQPSSVFRLSCNDSVGSPGIFPRSLFAALKQLPPGEGGSYLLRGHPGAGRAADGTEKKIPTPVRRIEAASAWELYDVDTQEALAVLENLQFSTNSADSRHL